MLFEQKTLLIITNLYPVPWGKNRASFNKQQFDLIAEHQSVRIIILIPWIEWLNNLRQCKTTDEMIFCPYFYIPKIGRSLVPSFQLFSLLFCLPWIKKHQPSWIIASWGFPDAIAVSMLNKFLKLPFFVKVHGSDVNENVQFLKRSQLMRKWLNKANTIFCASHALAESLNKIGIEQYKLSVNYNGVNPHIFYPVKVKPKKYTMIFVGSLILTKGVNELFSAFLIVQKRYPHSTLDILGEGAMKTSLAERIIKHQLSHCVKLKGSVSLSTVAKYIRNANILILPSYREGVPNVLLESFASGTPVIATKVGGIPEIVNENVGLLVEAKSTIKLAEAMEKALSTTWLTKNILDHARQFNWQKNVQHVLNKIGL